MKIFQSWTRNEPSAAGGYGITLKIVYTSFNKSEIDEVERKLPKVMLVMIDEKQSEAGNQELERKDICALVEEKETGEGRSK